MGPKELAPIENIDAQGPGFVGDQPVSSIFCIGHASKIEVIYYPRRIFMQAAQAEGETVEAAREWRRTPIQQNGELSSILQSWSLYDIESGLEIACISKQSSGDWKYVIRVVRDGELKDQFRGLKITGLEAKQYCEAQTSGCKYEVRADRRPRSIAVYDAAFGQSDGHSSSFGFDD